MRLLRPFSPCLSRVHCVIQLLTLSTGEGAEGPPPGDYKKCLKLRANVGRGEAQHMPLSLLLHPIAFASSLSGDKVGARDYPKSNGRTTQQQPASQKK